MSLAKKLMMVAAAPGGWDLANATFNPGTGDFNTLGLQGQTFNEASKNIFFTSDGLSVYAVGSTSRTIAQYSLSTAWYLPSATYVQNFSVATQDLSPRGLYFSPDGTKMYITGVSNDRVYQYSLSTAWDVSTASYLQNFSVATQETNPNTLVFKPDGTEMYVAGSTSDSVHQYSLSTAWDISTASLSTSFSVSTEDTGPTSLFFKSDGLEMFMGGTASDVNHYSLSTAWDLSTASYQDKSFLMGGGDVSGMFFKPDGTELFVNLYFMESIRGYDLSTAWDVTTLASFPNSFPSENYFSIASEETNPYSVTLSPDGLNMYVMGTTGDDVNQYSLSTAWDITTASYLQKFYVGSQELTPRGHRWKTDGTAIYIVGTSGDDVNQYSLSTAWDVSTMSYVQSFSVSAQDTSPGGIFISPDGLNMYICGGAGRDVNQYALSTAWDISTASYVRNRSVTAQVGAGSFPWAIFFKPDGTYMYIASASALYLTGVFQYRLTTPWNISTTVFEEHLQTGQYDYYACECFFREDGKKLYTVGYNFDAVWSFDL